MQITVTHLRSGQEQGSDKGWKAQERDSAWGSQRGCRLMTGGNLKRSYDCSAWVEEAYA